MSSKNTLYLKLSEDHNRLTISERKGKEIKESWSWSSVLTGPLMSKSFMDDFLIELFALFDEAGLVRALFMLHKRMSACIVSK